MTRSRAAAAYNLRLFAAKLDDAAIDELVEELGQDRRVIPSEARNVLTVLRELAEISHGKAYDS